MDIDTSNNLLDVSLSQEELDAINHEMAIYPHPQAAAIDALLIVQKKRGWISDPVLSLIARHLSMSDAELDSVASFYNLIYRRPVGKYVIKCCDSASCWLLDGQKLYQHLQQRLSISPGETTSDGRFTLLPCVCLGDCDNAPALMINDQHHHQVTPEGLDQIIDALAATDTSEVQ